MNFGDSIGIANKRKNVAGFLNVKSNTLVH